MPAGVWCGVAELRDDAIAAELHEVSARLGQDAAQLARLAESVATRSVIDQALGVLMDQNRCDAGQAFETLRRASNNRNVKLRDLAAEIVASVAERPP